MRLKCIFPFDLLFLEGGMGGSGLISDLTTIAESLEALGRRSGKRSKDYFTIDLTEKYKF